jgi:hypothetical protein
VDIDRLLVDKQPEVLTWEQKLNRIHNLLRQLAEAKAIVNAGSGDGLSGYYQSPMTSCYNSNL